MIGILAKRVPGKQAKNGHVWKRTLLNEGGGGGWSSLILVPQGENLWVVVALQNTRFITETGKGM